MTITYPQNVSDKRLNHYACVVFDLDGTLIDTLCDLASSVNYALASQQLPQVSVDDVRSFTGNGIRTLIERSCPASAPLEVVDAVFAAFKDYYAKHDLDTTKPYPQIPQLIAHLRKAGIRVGVASNKADFAVQRIISELMPHAFDAVVGERADIARKPQPDMVDHLLSQMQVGRENLVYVGDSEIDIQTAQQLNCPCIACTWGFRSEKWLRDAGAHIFAHSVEELERILLG